MLPGVYIGKQSTGDYGLVSTGDYLNPVTDTFRLKDLKQSITHTQTLYAIINNVNIEYVKIELTGQMTMLRCFLSWAGDSWASYIEYTTATNAINDTIILPFRLQIVVDDFLEYFTLVGENAYTQYKLRVMYV